MCTYCHEHEPLEHDDCCAHCLVSFRIEVVNGLRSVGEYLAAWAAFQDWCNERELAAV